MPSTPAQNDSLIAESCSEKSEISRKATRSTRDVAVYGSHVPESENQAEDVLRTGCGSGKRGREAGGGLPDGDGDGDGSVTGGRVTFFGVWA